MNKYIPKKYLRPGEFVLVTVVFLAVLGILYYIYFTPNYYEGLSPVKFEIRRGESLSSVIDRLYEAKIIPSKMNMRIASFIYGADTKVRAARYKIQNGLSYLDLLDLFIKGEAEFLKTIKIFNGISSESIAMRLRSELFIDSTEFIHGLRDDSLIKKIDPDIKSLNGFLLPKTYYFYENSAVSEILDSFVNEFNNLISDTVKKRTSYLGYSLDDIITIASIVEGETNNIKEMPVIAGVYYNRLKIGMRLQADPTIQFILKDWRRLTFQDLQIKSPYNTYMYAGLPPGPIGNPGKDALMAAFYPARHKYLYFVADTSGGHKFSESFKEHTRYAGEYRKWLDRQVKP